MKKAGLVVASILPGMLFAYALLAGILIKRVRPLPITSLPAGPNRRKAPKRGPVPV